MDQSGAARKTGQAQKLLAPALSAYGFDLLLLQLQLFYKEQNLNQKQKIHISKEYDSDGICVLLLKFGILVLGWGCSLVSKDPTTF